MQLEIQELPQQSFVQNQIKRVQKQKCFKFQQNIDSQQKFQMKKQIFKSVLSYISSNFGKNSNDIGIFKKVFKQRGEYKQIQINFDLEVKVQKKHVLAQKKQTSIRELEEIVGHLKDLSLVKVSFIQQITKKLFPQSSPQVHLLIKYIQQLQDFILGGRYDTKVFDSLENESKVENSSFFNFDQFSRVATCRAASLFCSSLFQSQIGKIYFLQNRFNEGITIFQKSLNKTINFIQNFHSKFHKEIQFIKPNGQANTYLKQTDLNSNLFDSYKKNVRRTNQRYDSMYGYYYFEDINKILKFQHLDHVILVALNHFQFSLKHYLLKISSFKMYKAPSIDLFKRNLDIMELLLRKSKQFVQILQHYLKFISLESMTDRLQYSLSRSIEYEVKLSEYFEFLSLKIKNKNLDREGPLKGQINPIFVSKFYCIGLILIENQDMKQAIKYFQKAQIMQSFCFGKKSIISLKILKKIVSVFRTLNQTKKVLFYEEMIEQIMNPPKTQEEIMMELNVLENQKRMELQEKFQMKKLKYPNSANLFQKKLFLEMDENILSQIQGSNKNQVQIEPKMVQNNEYDEYNEMDEQA